MSQSSQRDAVPPIPSGERAVLDHLADAWNQFVRLAPTHPSDLPEFQAGIHRLQDLVAMRIVRILYPEVFPVRSSPGTEPLPADTPADFVGDAATLSREEVDRILSLAADADLDFPAWPAAAFTFWRAPAHSIVATVGRSFPLDQPPQFFDHVPTNVSQHVDLIRPTYTLEFRSEGCREIYRIGVSVNARVAVVWKRIG